MKVTLEVAKDKLSKERALWIVDCFILNYPDNHRSKNAYNHGVGFRYDYPEAKYYAWGNPDHVRVRQEP